MQNETRITRWPAVFTSLTLALSVMLALTVVLSGEPNPVSAAPALDPAELGVCPSGCADSSIQAAAPAVRAPETRQPASADAQPVVSTTGPLQFQAGNHLAGFLPTQVYLAALDHALSVEFVGTAGVTPQTVGSDLTSLQDLSSLNNQLRWLPPAPEYKRVQLLSFHATAHGPPATSFSRVSGSFLARLDHFRYFRCSNDPNAGQNSAF